MVDDTGSVTTLTLPAGRAAEEILCRQSVHRRSLSIHRRSLMFMASLWNPFEFDGESNKRGEQGDEGDAGTEGNAGDKGNEGDEGCMQGLQNAEMMN